MDRADPVQSGALRKMFLPWFTSKALPFRLPLDHEKALLAATGVIFVLTVISFVFKPSGAGVVSIGWGFGAFVGLVAAVAAVAPFGLPFLRSRAGH